MPTTAKLRARLEDLRTEAKKLYPGPRHFVISAFEGQQEIKYKAWLSALDNVLSLFISNPYNSYRMSLAPFTGILQKPVTQLDLIAGAALLDHVIEDIDAGLFGSIENGVSAATFGDLLDHAEAYLKDQRKEPAGVLAGVVFEDSARRVYRNVIKLPDKGVDLEQIINALQKSTPPDAPTITGVEGKRAKAAADVRTQATHARWAEFNASDVRATIDFTREFIRKHLA